MLEEILKQMLKEKKEMNLKGASKTGNCQDPKKTANTIKTDTGEKMLKKSVKKKEIKEKAPMYAKDPAPIGDQTKESDMLKEEIQKIKSQMAYGKKTQ